MAISCALAKAKLARFVGELRQASTVEKTTTAIKAGFLTSPTTLMKAAGGNASWNALNELAIKPVAVAVDYINAIGKSARTRFKVTPTEFRTLASSLDADGVGAMLRGFGRGTGPTTGAARAAFAEARQGHFRESLHTFVRELSTRLDAENVANSLEFDRVKYKSPVVQTLVDGAFSVQEAVDRPYFFLSFNSSLYAQARLMAIKEGAKGADLRARSARYFEGPTDEMLARATDDAMWATFKDRNILSRGATGLKTALVREAELPLDPKASPIEAQRTRTRRVAGKVGSYAAETTIPFTGVPSSIAAKIANQTPLGLLGIAASTSPQVLARRIAVSGVGTAMWALGYELADKGLLTGAYPRTPAERADWEQRGRQSWSLKLFGHWVDIRWLGPVAAPLFMGAALHRIREDKPDAGVLDVATGAAAESGKLLTEQTYLVSLNRVISAAQDPERRGAALVASQIPTPAVVGRVARAADPYRRAPATFADRAAGRFGAGATQPRAQGTFGDLPPKTTAERLSGVLLPGDLRKSRETPVLDELARLRVNIGKPGKTVRLLGEPLSRTAEEYRALVNDVGPKVEATLARLIASDEYKAATDEERAQAIERVVTNIRALANAQFKAGKEEEVRRQVLARRERGSPPK